MKTILERIESASDYIKSRIEGTPSMGLILGSGLGDFAHGLDDRIVIPFGDIPGFPLTTVEGHSGALVLGQHQGRLLVALSGRVHYYEGQSQQVITIPVRVMARLGVKTILLTNAAGGVNLGFSQGALMLISDHINYSGQNPLIGPNLESFGPRFPDMSDIYSRTMRDKLKEEARREGIDLEEGVYAMYSGPNYETPAEIRMLRGFGADAVGMSTVPEALVACHAGLKVLGISCITNMAAGVLDQPLDHAE
ncbi:MAG: purine-nucleoside phosphorylase, partial [Clostridiaceae bacterium]|nr:purine-nucleoside phosphorylase [Clostridiaceae bacterium]